MRRLAQGEFDRCLRDRPSVKLQRRGDEFRAGQHILAGRGRLTAEQARARPAVGDMLRRRVGHAGSLQGGGNTRRSQQLRRMHMGADEPALEQQRDEQQQAGHARQARPRGAFHNASLVVRSHIPCSTIAIR